jgi:hypothetical protein
MSNELTEAERAVAEALAAYENAELRRDHGCRDGKHIDGTDCVYDNRATSADYVDYARAAVDAVRPLIEAEITQHPDVNNMNRGFGNCPHCLSPRVAHCHECLNNTDRDSAHADGWRMDHIGGFGCIALCPDCRNDNP